MCEQCALAAEWYYPNLSDEERGEILMSATCFPFGGPEDVEEQLKELIEKTDGTLMGALCFAEQEMDKQWEDFKKTEAYREMHNERMD